MGPDDPRAAFLSKSPMISSALKSARLMSLQSRHGQIVPHMGFPGRSKHIQTVQRNTQNRDSTKLHRAAQAFAPSNAGPGPTNPDFSDRNSVI